MIPRINSFIPSHNINQVLHNNGSCVFTVSSQAKVLTGSRDLCEAQVDVPLYVSHSCVWPHRWAL